MAYDTAIVIGMASISFLFAYLGMNIDNKKHSFLQILFLALALVSSLNIVGSMFIITSEQSISSFDGLLTAMSTVQTWAILIFVAYLFLYFMYEIIRERINDNKRRRSGGLEPLKPEAL